jgi:hypothetical protein
MNEDNSILLLNNNTLEDCYNSWEQIIENYNTGPWLTSNLHTSNRIDMLDNYLEVWS